MNLPSALLRPTAAAPPIHHEPLVASTSASATGPPEMSLTRPLTWTAPDFRTRSIPLRVSPAATTTSASRSAPRQLAGIHVGADAPTLYVAANRSSTKYDPSAPVAAQRGSRVSADVSSLCVSSLPLVTTVHTSAPPIAAPFSSLTCPAIAPRFAARTSISAWLPRAFAPVPPPPAAIPACVPCPFPRPRRIHHPAPATTINNSPTMANLFRFTGSMINLPREPVA